MYATVAGLKPIEPGYKKALIAPRPGGSLSEASYAHDSIIGKWQVSWTKTDAAFNCAFTIPANASASVHLPVDSIESCQINGTALAEHPDISDLRVEDDGVHFEAVAGSYACLQNAALGV